MHQVPSGAEREWFFYEGLKNMAKVRDIDQKKALEKIKQEVFVDYADRDPFGNEMPSHLPKALTLGLMHAK